MNELKPCPFCGYDHPYVAKTHGGWEVFCSQCGARIGRTKEADQIEERWNTRTDNLLLVGHGRLDPIEDES